MATSYNGWAASRSPDAIGVVPFNPLGIVPFANGGFAGGVKGGDVEAVFHYLVVGLNDIEPIMTDPNTGQLGYGCWGYSYRANVNNPSTLSCHASATALDYNAPRHGNGTSVAAGNSGWSPADVVRVRALLRHIGVVRWLEGNDPMHFEIHGTADEVRYVANKIRSGALGSDPLEQGHPAPDPPAEVPISTTTLRKKDDQVPIFMQTTPGEGGKLYMLIPGRAKQWLNGQDWDLWQRLYPEWKDLPGSPFYEVQIDTVNAQYQPTASAGGTSTAPPKTYTVQPGDTLSGIGAKLGVDWHDIARLNNIPGPGYEINPGDVLKVSS